MEININNKCRICLCDNELMYNIFIVFDQSLSLRDILSDTTGFEFNEKDGFSPLLCNKCTNIVVDFFNLKNTYQENQAQVQAAQENINYKNEFPTKKEFSESESEHEEVAEKSDDDNNLAKTEELKIIFENKQETVEEIGEENRQINKLSCPNCEFVFVDEEDLKYHLKHVHNTGNVECEAPIMKVERLSEMTLPQNKCKMCPLYFDDTETYLEHFKTHKKFVCDVCGAAFIKKSYLRDHRDVHFKELKHTCNFCHKAFRRRTVLAKHKRIHTHPRQCICEVCGDAFNDLDTLKTHNLLKHIKSRNYQCLICGVKFSLKGILEKHVKRHQNQGRKFFCNQCPAAYKDKSSLDRHISVKHCGNSESKMIVCDICGKQYENLISLKKHSRLHRKKHLKE